MANILLIDDDYRMRALVKTIIHRKTHHEVLAVAEGRFGLEQATLCTPDLILLDIELPDMDGFEVCRCLKANPLTSPIPVIIITCCGTTDAVVKAYQHGADDYAIKPFASTRLLAKVAKHLAASAAYQNMPAPAVA